VSDVGIVFPWWFILGVALMIALPVTTAIMVGLGVAASAAEAVPAALQGSNGAPPSWLRSGSPGLPSAAGT